MTEIVWQDPPDVTGRGKPRAKHAEFFDALRGNPGKWALFPDRHKHPSITTRIRQGVFGGTQAGEFEASSRLCDDGLRDVYVRYVGGES